MNPVIAQTAGEIISLYERQRAVLLEKPSQFLNDLRHEAIELQRHEDFSVRTAAEINRTAAVIILEERGK